MFENLNTKTIANVEQLLFLFIIRYSTVRTIKKKNVKLIEIDNKYLEKNVVMIQYVYDKNNRELIMVSYIQKIIECKTWSCIGK